MRNPHTELTKELISRELPNILSGKSYQEYGVWVFYPWLSKLVHLLDEPEFVECRTNRNKYKITDEEQQILSTKKVGVAGLSVGQSVSLTMAMERSFGELRIADFDLLDLSNLNRIRTGIQNLGLPKTTIVAREIAEIDPFLNVVIFKEGLTEENLHDFMTKDGNLDLMIDECDGLHMKYALREKAKTLGIPVVMDTSDNGMIDVERYDLDPNYPILHGLMDGIDYTKAKGLKKNEDKVPYALPIMGLSHLSVKMKASMLEIDQSINTWPQLASSVIYGGGLTGDLVRRIFLKETSISGRFLAAPDRILSTPVEVKKNDLHFPEFEPNRKDHPDEFKYDNVVSLNAVEILLRAGIISPSSGNMQPWKFRKSENKIEIILDVHREDPFGDYLNRASLVSIGCCLESMVQCANNLGIEHNYVIHDRDQPQEVAVEFSIHSDAKNTLDSALWNNLLTRHTSRNPVPNDGKIPEGKLDLLSQENWDNGNLQLISSAEQLEVVREIIAEADSIRFLNEKAHAEFFEDEIRWDEAHASEKA
ncbi:MAG: Rv1355c family protein, partial [Bacteroidota bacterium]